MLTEKEANNLINELIHLRNEVKQTNDKNIIKKYKKHHSLCVEKFKYLITMRTGRYKNFPNYEDLNQEGYEALIKAMENYDPSKGSFFWWGHKYIETRIARSANLHTTIRFPLKFAKENTPHKESILPTIIENRFCPDKNLEQAQVQKAIQEAMKFLSADQKTILNYAFGIDGDKPMSINKICKKLNLSRSHCVKAIDTAMSIIKQKIKL